MSACTICGRESSTCPGHLNERSNEWTPEMLQVCGGIPRTVQELVAELKRVQDEHAETLRMWKIAIDVDGSTHEQWRDQARVEALALRDALDRTTVGLEWSLTCEPSPCRCVPFATPPHICERHLALAQAEQALATPSLEVAAHAYKAAILVHAQQYGEEDLDELWENSILRASLGKEGA